MSRYQVIIFDLDGTITDPKTGILNSILHALTRLGIRERRPDELISFIGPPLHRSFQERYTLDEKTARLAVSYYREYFAGTGIYENAVYPGMGELLEKLNRDGRVLCVATAKPTIYTEKILDHFRLGGLFSHVAGSNMDGTMTEKDEVIASLLERLPEHPADRTVMVGDREHDILGARANGIRSIAVAFGYGSLDELTAAGPDHLAHSVAELRELLT